MLKSVFHIQDVVRLDICVPSRLSQPLHFARRNPCGSLPIVFHCDASVMHPKIMYALYGVRNCKDGPPESLNI